MMNSLGFDKSPQDTCVVVAMSGGVDSSVVAAHLKKQGYHVIGVTLQLYDQGPEPSPGSKTCCAGRDIRDARQVANDIGIPYYVLDYENRFKQDVIEPFAQSYLQGYTPVPCVRCNQTVKFRDLMEMAQNLGADCLATGHYVQRTMGQKGAQMLKAVDHQRDQSYFLFTTTQEQLDFLRFPLGNMKNKDETRLMAQNYSLSICAKPDSQDICFVPNGRYADFVKKMYPQASKKGDIVHMDGRILAQHEGLIHYTVGQRKGLGLGALKDPLYVIKLDPQTHQVIVGPKEALGRVEISLQQVNWIADTSLTHEPVDVSVKLRSAMQPVPAQIKANGKKDGAMLILYEPHFGAAPGQAGVIYDQNRLLGGGWIEKMDG